MHGASEAQPLKFIILPKNEREREYESRSISFRKVIARLRFEVKFRAFAFLAKLIPELLALCNIKCFGKYHVSGF